MISVAARAGAVAPSARQSTQEDPEVAWALPELVIAPTVPDGRDAPHDNASLLPGVAAGSVTTIAVSCAPLLAHGAPGTRDRVRRHSVG
jgi:hypothetical protein